VARELLIVWAGRHQRSNWEELCAAYRRRLTRLAAVRDLPVRARIGPGDPQRRRVEGEALLAAAGGPSWVVALDSRGENLTSELLAQRLGELRRGWPHAVAFLVGSDLGLDAGVLQAARWVLSLGPLTLSHELARLVLYEQLYRALSIEAGMSYHREPP
jgi:23S rRNA (pseudouridine1915-N3)-methyltransferase